MDNMSTNINELNEIDIQKLTSNIHKEIELGKTDDYINMERLNNLQQIQMQKLQQLDDQIKKEKEDEIEEIKEKVSYFEIVKNPIILLLLYVLLNHKDVILLINNIKPLLIKDNYIVNLLSNGIILITTYFILIKIME
jgi:hypothetical protein|tara:strand:+ start:840 stop:1253 length:414 start_codon:yes stop_codon:yes gene_type:complete